MWVKAARWWVKKGNLSDCEKRTLNGEGKIKLAGNFLNTEDMGILYMMRIAWKVGGEFLREFLEPLCSCVLLLSIVILGFPIITNNCDAAQIPPRSESSGPYSMTYKICKSMEYHQLIPQPHINFGAGREHWPALGRRRKDILGMLSYRFRSSLFRSRPIPSYSASVTQISLMLSFFGTKMDQLSFH
ncbi:hypothetical protein PM082_021917 [Marasmius tenuissimus]|nr:hypothetical protein PM082_021917 [Marasmius tenuissimus]